MNVAEKTPEPIAGFISVDKQTFCPLVLYCHTTVRTFARIWSTLIAVRETRPC